MSSKVYHLNDRAGSLAESTPFKGVKVLRDAGLAGMVKKGDHVAIKVHMGEWGNSLNLRPHWISAIVDEVKRLGGEPFIVESTIAIYSENVSRATRTDHLRVAAIHGFTEETMGCPIVICDGEYGTDDLKVEVPNGVYLKYAYIAKKLLDFDAVIVVSHFKGHVMGVFGGAMKNIGIGMASARGKYAIHNVTHPQIGIKGWSMNQDAVKKLSESPHPNIIDRMVENCPYEAFSYENNFFDRDNEKCRLCGYCFAYLYSGVFDIPPALIPSWPAGIADAASGFVNAIGKEKMIFLNYAMDITPACDCMPFHDKAMVPNLGVYASRDPVAVDMACIEAAESTVAVPDSVADEYGFDEPNTERFTNCSSMAKISQWAQLNTAVFNGMGTTEYVLVNSKVQDSEEFNFPPYTTAKPFTNVHKKEYSKISMDPGDYCYDYTNPRLSMEKQSVKPKGKVLEISISEDR
ncbi:DUF362 domain-containing protein [Clostridium sp. KNHs216]|uniref:DUF362 domain-containing protein n=1 Tax=Clostridium sp. KNHs216 TaxID=1550235 RepID=UPI001152549C|nr:DUF362 domain-containing protein [Clostridium sp. KNHs216]TQI67076.1 hypothetical protein LY85_1760 [Clostridium sp. KNHs216]